MHKALLQNPFEVFAQSEYFMLGMYVAMAIIWTDYFLPDFERALSDCFLKGIFDPYIL